MAAIHILDKQGGEYRIVVHATVPNTNNSAGINHRTALVNSKLGGTTILPDGDGTAGTISAAEKTSVLAGAVLEVVATIRADNIATGAPLNAWLDAEAARISNEKLAELGVQLKYYGAVRV